MPFPTPTILAAAAAAVLTFAAQPAAAQGVPAGTLRLNDTGLNRCTHDFSHFGGDCAGTGQDGEYGRDVEFPAFANGHAGFSFLKVCNSGQAAGTGTCSAQAALGAGPDDWGCTIDRVTGLEWEVKTRDGGLRDAGTTYTDFGDGRDTDADAFVSAVNAQSLCGQADWRLPTTHEIQGIVDFDHAFPTPSIDSRFFPNTLAAHYWTSEPYVTQETTVAWVGSFIMDPSNVNVTTDGRTARNPVRLVREYRHGQAGDKKRYTFEGDEVTDHWTHLTWLRCSAGQSWDGTKCTGARQHFGFPAAFKYAQQQAAASGKAWRVPNAKELHSIVDHTVVHPAVNTHAFPGTGSELYWTGTPYAWTATGGWALNFDGGHVLAYYQSYSLALRLVRDAD